MMKNTIQVSENKAAKWETASKFKKLPITAAQTKLHSIKTAAQTKLQSIKTAAQTKLHSIKTAAQTNLQSIKTGAHACI